MQVDSLACCIDSLQSLPDCESNDGDDAPSDWRIIEGGTGDWIEGGHDCNAANEQEVEHSKCIDGSAGFAQVDWALHKLAAVGESFEGEGDDVSGAPSCREIESPMSASMIFTKGEGERACRETGAGAASSPIQGK